MAEAATMVILALAAGAAAVPAVLGVPGGVHRSPGVADGSSSTGGSAEARDPDGGADASHAVRKAADPTQAAAPVTPPPIPVEPPFVFTDGPCPPGYDRVSVDAVDAAGRFTAGFSYCERRGPERSTPPHEDGSQGDRDRPIAP